MTFSSFSAIAALNYSDSESDDEGGGDHTIMTSVESQIERVGKMTLNQTETPHGSDLTASQVVKKKKKKKQRSARKRTLDIHGSRNTRCTTSQKKVFLADNDGRPISRKSENIFANDDFFSPAKIQEKSEDNTNRIRGWFSTGELDSQRQGRLQELIQTLNSLPACTNMVHGAKDRFWFKRNRCMLLLARSVRERELLREAFNEAFANETLAAHTLIVTTWKDMRGSKPNENDLRWAGCVFARWESERIALDKTEQCAQEIFGNKKMGGCWGDSDSDDEEDERDTSCRFK